MSFETADGAPTLAHGVRLRRLEDGSVVLLVPEGIVNLNPWAAAVVELVDSRRTAGEIARELSGRYGNTLKEIESDVSELLDRLAARTWIAFGSADRSQ